MTAFATELVGTGQLRAGSRHRRGRATCCGRMNSVNIYELLVLDRGWDAERYGRFVAERSSPPRWSVLAEAPRRRRREGPVEQQPVEVE